jgi:hypothetical protein
MIYEKEEQITSFNYNIKDEDDNYEPVQVQNITDVQPNLVNNKINIRKKVQLILNSTHFQWIVIVLVLLDTLCVSGELVIIIENNKQSLRKLKTFHDILKYSGISILGLFLLEIIIKISFDTREFLQSKLEIFDSFVVIISLVLDILFFNYDTSSAFELITMLRLWRIGRIINGLIHNFNVYTHIFILSYLLGTIIAIETREELKRKKLTERINRLKTANLRLLTEIMKRDALINQYKISNSKVIE